MAELSLAQQLLVAMGKLARRSDVVVERQAFWSGPVGRWKDALPADMLQFYEELNGFAFRWRFIDDPSEHGCLLLALHDDGRTVIDPGDRSTGLPYQTLEKYGEYFIDQEAGFDLDGKVLFFQGATDSAGTLLVGEKLRTATSSKRSELPARSGGELGGDPEEFTSERGGFRKILKNYKFWSWNNDGDVALLGDSFTDYVQRGISLAFCHMWESPGHPIPQAVARRLATKVEARKTFEVEVESVESFPRVSCGSRRAAPWPRVSSIRS